MDCPKCGSDNVTFSTNSGQCTCQDCKYKAHPEEFKTVARNGGRNFEDDEEFRT